MNIIEFGFRLIHGHDEERSRESHMEIFEYEGGWEIPELARKCDFPIHREYHGMGCNSVGKYSVHSYHIETKSSKDFARKIQKIGLFPKTDFLHLIGEIENSRLDNITTRSLPSKFFRTK